MAPEPSAETTIESIPVDDADAVARRMPWRQPSRHLERAAAQKSERAVYLIAWKGARPVGHSFVKWPGDLSSRRAQLEGCVEVEDLFVVVEERGRGIGAALLEASETAAREQGFTTIGLAVALENVVARRLYAARGYRDAGHGVFSLSWTSLDERGVERRTTEKCIYLVKAL
jgi:GNAT superfamily N-acetyltransferase